MTRGGWISNLRKACAENKDPSILNRYREGEQKYEQLTYDEANELLYIYIYIK